MKRLLATGFLALSAFGAQAGANAVDVLACVRGNVPATPTVSQVAVTTTEIGTGDSTTLAGRIYTARANGTGADSQLWAMLRVYKPERLDGAAYLVRATNHRLTDEMFVYLPAVGRVRRITGSYANRPLLGTSFSYFDFKQLWNAFADLTATGVRPPETIGGRTAYVLRMKPKGDAGVDYSGVTVWIDQKTCLPLRAEFRRQGKPVKRFTAPQDKIRQVQGRWYLGEIHMRDLANNERSVMRIQNVKHLEQPKGRYFDPKTFHNPK